MKLFDFGDGGNVFFTSDTHFYHDRIIGLCERPFSDVEDMNNTLIDKWNKMVGDNDIVFHLGDFCFGGPNKWLNILEQLNWHIYLIMGNHDFKNLKDNVKQYFTDVTQQMRIQIDGWTLYLNHYPYLCYGGAWNLDRKVGQVFGHVHSSPTCNGKDKDRMRYLFPTQYDVGVDNNDYKPVSWGVLKQKFEDNIKAFN